MKIKIYRGTHQIGGCVTEIRSEKARILIDFGMELEDNPSSLLIDGVNSGNSSCDGIFFTHYHGDHIGMLNEINKDIPLYMGNLSKELLLIQNQRSPLFDDERLNGVISFSVGEKIKIKDIVVTPFMVDHSAFDAYMFLIEVDGTTILHTGDFRTHGYRGKGLDYVIENYLPKIDCLICEGTTINRDNSVSVSEHELSLKASEVFRNNKYVFVVSASTNIDRIAGFCSAVPKGKYCLCDSYQKSVLDKVKEHSGDKSKLYSFDKMLVYGSNLEEKLVKNGFVMFVRAGSTYFKDIMNRYKEYNPLIVYSMWKGYLEQDRVKEFVEGFNMVTLHTSGHADTTTLSSVIKKINPKHIIPIHTEVPEEYEKISNGNNVVVLNDCEEFEL